MDVDLKDLEDRVAEAELRVRRITHLMLRAVWQYVTRHRSFAATSSSCIAAAGCKARNTGFVSPLPSATRSSHPKKSWRTLSRRSGPGVPVRGVDQARVSRELYRRAFGAARHEVEKEEKGKDNAMAVPGDEDGIPSVALLLLQSARGRAIMFLCFLRLRLAACRRRLLNDECELRYSYYRLRRTLRAWGRYAHSAKLRREALLSGVLDHWIRLVTRCRFKKICLRRFLLGLKNRRNAFKAVCQHKLRRCFFWWRRRLDVCRTVGTMEERAKEMRRKHKYIDLGFRQRASIFAIKERTFFYWKRKTEHRLDAKLAEMMCRRSYMRRAWKKLLCYYTAVILRRTLPCPPAPSVLPTIHVKTRSTEFVMFESHYAQQVARGNLKKSVFGKWHARYLERLSDLFFLFHCRLQVMKKWLRVVKKRRVARFTIISCFLRWRDRYQLRIHHTQADYWRRQRVQAVVLLSWRRRALGQFCHRRQALLSCLRRWWQKAKLRSTRRSLAVGIKRRALLAWRHVAEREGEHRTMLCVAETLRELVLLVGCFRRWKMRHQHACCVRISEGVLGDLRRERQRARLFQRWKRLTFGH